MVTVMNNDEKRKWVGESQWHLFAPPSKNSNGAYKKSTGKLRYGGFEQPPRKTSDNLNYLLV
eukprot:1718653-Amphidinium_carterae.1